MDPSTFPRNAALAVAYTQWAYWCSLAVAVLATRYIPEGSVRNAVVLTPILTATLCVSTAFWMYESCDEYLRRSILVCVVRTAVIVAGLTIAYFVAELAGAPKLSVLWVNLLGWSVFNLQFLVLVQHSR